MTGAFGERRTMKAKSTKRIGLRGLALGTVLAAGSLSGAVSERLAVWTKPDESIQWKTLTANPAPLSLDWPTNAVAARLTVDLGNGRTASHDIANEGQQSYAMAVVFPSGQADERVFGLALAYKDANDAQIGSTLTARLGLVNGVAGGTTRCVPSKASAKWRKSEGTSFVVPIPENATGLTVDSVPILPLDPCGWHFVKGDATQVVDLTLSASGQDPKTVQVRFGGGGFVIFIK